MTMHHPDPSPVPAAAAPDADPDETHDWLASLAEVIARDGVARAEFLVQQLIDHGRRAGGRFHTRHTTPYRNTIPVSAQPPYPGDLDLEARLTAMHRWNALAMVMRANLAHPELGGHIATYASIADLFEVGFHHFFRARSEQFGGDLVYFQPHAAPGVYARAFLEGRLSENNLIHFRREVSGGVGNGLSSYAHPTLMPEFWQFPTGSMGLGLLSAIYQARFLRYLQHRELVDNSGRKVWAFVGDGEMDEPESLAGISLAAREQLDNLILVVNCNLQRLDGPVRGNGNIVQELETLFAGAGWNVIKVLWGSNWDVLFARDTDGWILRRMAEAVDGEFQKLSATDGNYNRERFFSKYPQLAALVANMSDGDIDALRRGGHDPIKIYAAYAAAVAHRGAPTVILAQTTKGFGMGLAGQGANTAHQTKKLPQAELKQFRDRFDLPLSDADLDALRFLHPGADSRELRYLQERRAALGGLVPARRSDAPALALAQPDVFQAFYADSGEREISTTMAFVRLLSKLLRDATVGARLVPIVADEARTFGMQDMFRQVGIYSPWGQLYEPQDSDQLTFYREDVKGQILEEGISEAGALASWIAAGTAYSHSGLPMLPCYIFYSMFGFQRVADLIWAAADSQARGFLLGATAGRTTLSGEGLQHEDGQSLLYAATVPTCRAYDPAFGYEVAVIVEDGMRRMLHERENIFYYITLYNENYVQPALPPEVRDGIVRGMYRLPIDATRSEPTPPLPRSERERERGEGARSAASRPKPRVRLLGSGTILREVIAAAALLQEDWKIPAEVWSVTSYIELHRDGAACERAARLGLVDAGATPFVTQCLAGEAPVIAASDYVRALPELIRAHVPARYVSLGTDGFGRSDTRTALRAFFEVDRHHIVLAALKALADDKSLPSSVVEDARRRYGLNKAEPLPPWRR